MGYFVCILKVSTPIEEICTKDPKRNAPRIAAIFGEETIQYFVIVEQRVLFQVSSFHQALFVAFSAYYVFNLAYPKQVQKLLLFLQDYVLAMPDSTKRPGTIASDINQFVSQA